MMNVYSRNFSKIRDLQKKIFFLKADLPSYYKLRKIDKTLIGKIIKNQFCIDISPNRINEIDRTLNKIYFLRINKEGYVIKISKTPTNTTLGLIIEEEIYKVLKKNFLPYVQILKTDSLGKRYGSCYQIAKKISGKSLENIKKKDLLKIIPQISYNLANIHKIKFDGFGSIDACLLLKKHMIKGLYKEWKEWILLNFREHIELCKKIGVLNKEGYEKMINWVEKYG